ncbi:MAG: hypothetical protein QOG38_1894 [Hyphomicrobiales bacterium]|jgi:ElaB/YqjD/DUF883 family membrane-anchored ribosome-binding protein|nr:hypothetical protein [Hyphomicrobiales bacterium]
MSFHTEPSVNSLRVEAEATRSRLTGTVEELRTQVADTATDLKERLSPQTIKTEVKQYVRESRDQLWHNLEQKARDNPLQAVAVGAALAYPALKLMRAMPAPLLLIGAGLLLSRSSGSIGVESGAVGTLRARAQETTDAAGRTFEAATESVRSKVNEAQDYAREKVNEAQDYARESVGAVVDGVSATASSLKDRAAGVANDATSALSNAADTVKGHAESFAQQARQTVSGTWDQNPLLVAGIGLAIGACIAAAFPTTQAEETMFGDANDALRRQAEGVAAKGIEAAKSAVEGVAAAASEQGLSADGLKGVGENLTEKVRAVAARGVETALGSTNANEPGPGQRKAYT